MTTGSIYPLGFAQYVLGLLPGSYTVVQEPAGTGPAVRCAVQNAAGERFVIDVEHVGRSAEVATR